MNIVQRPPSTQPAALFGDIPAGRAQSTSIPVSPAAAEAINALKLLDPHGRHNLVAIPPDESEGRPRGRTFEPGEWDAIAEWVDAHNGKWNCYFSANEPKAGAPSGKLRKEHIGAIRSLYVDKDPEDGVPLEEARRDLVALADRMQSYTLPPTMTIDSGGGVQLLWKLDQKLDASEHQQWAEQQGRGLAQLMSADPVQNIDRILRLPGTLNIPSAKKRQKGREPRVASLLHMLPTQVFSPVQFAEAVAPAPTAQHKDAERLVAASLEEIEAEAVTAGIDYFDLPEDLRTRFERAVRSNPSLDALWRGNSDGLISKNATGSDWRISLAKRLSQAADFSAADYALLACAWPEVTASLEVQSNLPRALARDWGKFGAPEIERRKELIQRFYEELPADEDARRATPVASTECFEALSIGDLKKMPNPRFIIDKHLPECGLGFLYGSPGAKKSFLALDWALHLAFGRPHWHGHAIEMKRPGGVVYLAGEGAAGFKVRVSAWMNHHGIPEDQQEAGRFRLIRQPVDFMNSEDMLKLARTLRKSIAAPVTAVVVDTVSRSMPGADENLQKDMTLFVKACDAIKDAFGCVVLGVHHANTQGKMRGSTVLLGAGDFVFRMEKKTDVTGRLWCEKQKDAPDGWSETYRFDVARSDDGLTSLVPVRMAGGVTGSTISAELSRSILAAMRKASDAGEPWAKKPQSKERYAVRRLVADYGLDADAAESLIDLWERTGVIVHEMVDRRNKRFGFRVVDGFEEDEDHEEEADSVFG